MQRPDAPAAKDSLRVRVPGGASPALGEGPPSADDAPTARVSRYTVNPADRIRELLFVDEIPETAELTYSFDGGYERLDYRESPNHGGVHFAGTYHPGGMCDGEHICSYCGSVHTYG